MSTEGIFQPKLLGIICNWCCYGGADLCGVSRFQYPPYIRIIRVMCSGRVDLLHILRAFSNGQDGVFIGGCHLCDCHYATHGNFDAFGMVQVGRKILKHIGMFPERLRIEWVSAGEGVRFANFMNEIGAELEGLGPLGKSEGLDESELKLGLEAALRIVPFMKLALTQRLKVLERTEEAYDKFFTSDEFDRLFEDLFADRLTISRIMLLLKERSLSMGEISEILKLSPSEVSRHMSNSSRRGWVRYDVERNRYALA